MPNIEVAIYGAFGDSAAENVDIFCHSLVTKSVTCYLELDLFSGRSNGSRKGGVVTIIVTLVRGLVMLGYSGNLIFRGVDQWKNGVVEGYLVPASGVPIDDSTLQVWDSGFFSEQDLYSLPNDIMSNVGVLPKGARLRRFNGTVFEVEKESYLREMTFDEGASVRGSSGYVSLKGFKLYYSPVPPYMLPANDPMLINGGWPIDAIQSLLDFRPYVLGGNYQYGDYPLSGLASSLPFGCSYSGVPSPLSYNDWSEQFFISYDWDYEFDQSVQWFKASPGLLWLSLPYSGDDNSFAGFYRFSESPPRYTTDAINNSTRDTGVAMRDYGGLQNLETRHRDNIVSRYGSDAYFSCWDFYEGEIPSVAQYLYRRIFQGVGGYVSQRVAAFPFGGHIPHVGLPPSSQVPRFRFRPVPLTPLAGGVGVNQIALMALDSVMESIGVLTSMSVGPIMKGG